MIKQREYYMVGSDSLDFNLPFNPKERLYKREYFATLNDYTLYLTHAKNDDMDGAFPIICEAIETEGKTKYYDLITGTEFLLEQNGDKLKLTGKIHIYPMYKLTASKVVELVKSLKPEEIQNYHNQMKKLTEKLKDNYDKKTAEAAQKEAEFRRSEEIAEAYLDNFRQTNRSKHK